MSKEDIKPGKGAPAEETNTAPVEPTTKKTNSIPVDRDQLAQILRENEEIKLQIAQLQSNAVSTQQGGNPMVVRTKKKETLVKLRRWDNKYVVEWENVGTEKKPVYVYNEYNPQTRDNIQFINVIMLDNKGEKMKPVKLEYLRYLQESEPVFVKLLQKIEEDPEIVIQGMVYKKDFVENGYGMFETTVQVPVEVITQRFSLKVQLEDGQELTVSERFVG